eukprot:EG_transcript_4459
MAPRRVHKVQEVEAHQGRVHCAAWDRAGTLFVTAGQKGHVNVWRIGQFDVHAQLGCVGGPQQQMEDAPITSTCLGGTGETCVAATGSGALKVYDVGSHQQVAQFERGAAPRVTHLECHPLSPFVCSGSPDGAIQVWDLRRQKCLQKYRQSQPVTALAFAPDGRSLVAGGEDGALSVWDLTAGKRLTKLEHHTRPLTTVAFHPADLLLAAASEDRTVTLWDFEKFQLKGQTEAMVDPGLCLQFSRDPSDVCCAAATCLALWDCGTVQCRASLALQWGSPLAMLYRPAEQELHTLTATGTAVSVWVARLPLPTSPRAPLERVASLGPAPLRSPPGSAALEPLRDKAPLPLPRQHTPPAATPPPLAGSPKQVKFQGRDQERPVNPTPDQPRQLRSRQEVGVQQAIHACIDGPTPDRRRSLEPLAHAAADQPIRRRTESLGPPKRSDDAELEDLLTAHRTVQRVLGDRLTHLQALAAIWEKDKRAAIRQVQSSPDPGVAMDFLYLVVKPHSDDITLEFCVLIMPAVLQVLQSTREPHLLHGIDLVKWMWQSFRDLIVSSLTQQQARRGGPISAVDRQQKCQDAWRLFSEARVWIEQCQRRPDGVGVQARLIAEELPQRT